MPKLLLHTALLAAATAGVYLWLASPLASYSLQLVAVLILIFAATHWTRSKFRAKPRRRNTIPLDSSLLVAAVLLLVTETGALTSPFFFFVYFLLFAVAMLFEIEATLALTAILVIYFLLLPGTNLGDIAHLSELLALVMVTPLALYTGHEYEQMVQSDRKRRLVEQQFADVETDTLTFLALNLKSTLGTSLDKLSSIIPATRVKSLRHDLDLLYQDLRNLYRSADELEKSLDQKTD